MSDPDREWRGVDHCKANPPIPPGPNPEGAINDSALLAVAELKEPVPGRHLEASPQPAIAAGPLSLVDAAGGVVKAASRLAGVASATHQAESPSCSSMG